MEDVRINNDLEGWHRRLNYSAKRGQLQMYLFIELLNKEGSCADETSVRRKTEATAMQKIQENTKEFEEALEKIQ